MNAIKKEPERMEHDSSSYENNSSKVYITDVKNTISVKKVKAMDSRATTMFLLKDMLIAALFFVTGVTSHFFAFNNLIQGGAVLLAMVISITGILYNLDLWIWRK